MELEGYCRTLTENEKLHDILLIAGYLIQPALGLSHLSRIALIWLALNGLEI